MDVNDRSSLLNHIWIRFWEFSHESFFLFWLLIVNFNFYNQKLHMFHNQNTLTINKVHFYGSFPFHVLLVLHSCLFLFSLTLVSAIYSSQFANLLRDYRNFCKIFSCKTHKAFGEFAWSRNYQLGISLALMERNKRIISYSFCYNKKSLSIFTSTNN